MFDLAPQVILVEQGFAGWGRAGDQHETHVSAPRNPPGSFRCNLNGGATSMWAHPPVASRVRRVPFVVDVILGVLAVLFLIVLGLLVAVLRDRDE